MIIKSRNKKVEEHCITIEDIIGKPGTPERMFHEMMEAARKGKLKIVGRHVKEKS